MSVMIFPLMTTKVSSLEKLTRVIKCTTCTEYYGFFDVVKFDAEADFHRRALCGLTPGDDAD